MAKRGTFQYTSNSAAYQVKISSARRDVLDAAALAGEGYAKEQMTANDTIDTGFALNSIHAVLSASDGTPATVATERDRNGRSVLRTSEGLPAMDDHTSAVGCGADYALWLELRAPFLYPALGMVKQDIPTLIAAAKRKNAL